MAADLSIHIFEGVTEGDLAIFFADYAGSKYENPDKVPEDDNFDSPVYDTPSIWIGEVSWLKAIFFEDDEMFIPSPVQAISDLVGEELPIIDDDFIEKARAAMELKNATGYKLANAEDVVQFLTDHKGKKVFAVSW